MTGLIKFLILILLAVAFFWIGIYYGSMPNNPQSSTEEANCGASFLMALILFVSAVSIAVYNTDHKKWKEK